MNSWLVPRLSLFSFSAVRGAIEIMESRQNLFFGAPSSVCPPFFSQPTDWTTASASAPPSRRVRQSDASPSQEHHAANPNPPPSDLPAAAAAAAPPPSGVHLGLLVPRQPCSAADNAFVRRPPPPPRDLLVVVLLLLRRTTISHTRRHMPRLR